MPRSSVQPRFSQPVSRNSNNVLDYRKRLKSNLVFAMGGKCAICGYNKCIDALEFHHLDAKTKISSISQMYVKIRKIEDILNEVKKCILLCSNCHKELHAGLAEITSIPSFNDSVFIKSDVITYCPVCNKIKKNFNHTCSIECSRKRRYVVNWEISIYSNY